MCRLLLHVGRSLARNVFAPVVKLMCVGGGALSQGCLRVISAVLILMSRFPLGPLFSSNTPVTL